MPERLEIAIRDMAEKLQKNRGGAFEVMPHGVIEAMDDGDIAFHTQAQRQSISRQVMVAQGTTQAVAEIRTAEEKIFQHLATKSGHQATDMQADIGVAADALGSAPAAVPGGALAPAGRAARRAN
jgi:hypothetical protein